MLTKDQIKVLPKDAINEVTVRRGKRTKKFSIIDLNPTKKFNREIIIAPHHRENYGNTGFLKLKAYCDRYNIKITSFGLLNQLPVFSIFSDKVILQNDDAALNNLYHGASTAGADKSFIPLLSKAMYAEVYTPFTQYVAIMNQTANIEDRPFMMAAAKTISDEETAEMFAHANVYIRQSSYELFHTLKLPSNVIVCEFKPAIGPKLRPGDDPNPIVNWVKKRGKYLSFPITGLDKEFQKKLLNEVGSHYMSIQIMASLINNWIFMCYGGSSNLMCLLPVKCLTMFDFWINTNPSTQNTIRRMAELRYGDIGSKVPVFPHPVTKLRKILDEHINDLNKAIKIMSNDNQEIDNIELRKPVLFL